VQTFYTLVQKNDSFYFKKKCLSFRVRNLGGTDVEIKKNNKSETIFSGGDGLVYGGYDDYFRDDIIDIIFDTPAVNPLVLVAQDLETEPPYWEIC